ncbi:lipoate--protein ligase family protein [Texcoconibacillus texcoconensis]|uniref:Octanoyl-[GcvH]:protein N-octanoyltransferase n=1 Tax=Texcoconibacillus texcoconensis TaxID=1095777 RepID=A0A840QS56_9BACI|nr:lipoate--protein ligase family protein [Texcoconibacillus texcoconensis]MBB5174131.1 octanoyl-[GcvH]:protein N-octanoyltransferase [Texcoconibacillus texcoconensis]
MNKLNTDLLKKYEWAIYDQSTVGLMMNALDSFATDDTLCQTAGEHGQLAIARTWVHDRTVVLGIQDSRLPYLEKGVQLLRQAGYNVIVRNSGGLAVVLDPGVLNVSLIFPDDKRIGIDEGYEAMVEFTKQLLSPYTDAIKDGEITESYCPGRYDLSIHGRKFAGISQRRLRGGIAVQIYLSVTGSGSERAELIRKFYNEAKRDVNTTIDYPTIVPEKMASLTECTGYSLDVATLTNDVLKTLHQYGKGLRAFELSGTDSERLQVNRAKIEKRNDKFF